METVPGKNVGFWGTPNKMHDGISNGFIILSTSKSAGLIFTLRDKTKKTLRIDYTLPTLLDKKVKHTIDITSILTIWR